MTDLFSTVNINSSFQRSTRIDNKISKEFLDKFVELANKDFSSLAKKYGLTCKNLVENPKERTNYWEKKGSKIIK